MKEPHWPKSTTRPLIIKTLFTIQLRKHRQGQRASMRSIPCYSRLTESWEFHSGNKKCSPGWRLTRSSIASRGLPRTSRNLPSWDHFLRLLRGGAGTSEPYWRYLGTVVRYSDNFFAALNSAVFSDGSFCDVPKGVRCPMELSTYFRINAPNIGQFERTLIIAEEGSYVSYLEGCTAPI